MLDEDARRVAAAVDASLQIERRTKLRNFVEATMLTEAEALPFLELHGWSIEAAMSEFLAAREFL